MICPTHEAKYFCSEGWTGDFSKTGLICPSGWVCEFVPARIAPAHADRQNRTTGIFRDYPITGLAKIDEWPEAVIRSYVPASYNSIGAASPFKS